MAVKAERLILHLGHGKTGSTSIQRSLRQSRRLMRETGILFPDPGRHDNHQLLFPHLWGELPHDPVQVASLGAEDSQIRAQAEGLWHRLLGQVQDERPKTLVLSCENQFRPFSETAYARLTQHCMHLAESVVVVAYLRRPASFFLSNVQQDVKKRPEFRPVTQSRVRDALEPAVRFGPGPVKAHAFDRSTLIGGDVVTDFVTRYLPEIPIDALTRANEANTSVTAEAMALLQDLFRGDLQAPLGFRSNLKALRKIVVATDSLVDGGVRPKLFDDVHNLLEARSVEFDWIADTLQVVFPPPPTGLTAETAENRYRKLKDVAQICPVDTHRKDALWAACVKTAQEAAGPLTRLRDRFKR